jgi:hypothetical protein
LVEINESEEGVMSCNCCNGVGHEFESKGMKCKIVIRDNLMSVNLPWNSADIEVTHCPLCGRELAHNNDALYEDLINVGDDIWYIDVDAKEKFIEHAKVEQVYMTNGQIDWFTVKFDNGDFDEFGPAALLSCCFKSQSEAEKVWELKHE